MAIVDNKERALFSYLHNQKEVFSKDDCMNTNGMGSVTELVHEEDGDEFTYFQYNA